MISVKKQIEVDHPNIESSNADQIWHKVWVQVCHQFGDWVYREIDDEIG